MSKLLKSKFLLGVIAVAVMFVGVVAVSNTASAETCTITKTLRVGSKGDEVKCLQAAVGVTADGSFGKMTAAAVKVWQASVGLTADGVFGKASRTAWMGGAVSGNFPAGCTSASGYSSTTGMACVSMNANTFPAGCTNASGFSTTTGMSCGASSATSQTGPVTAMLATTNPASGTIVAGQATADLLHVTFTGTGTVNSVTLTRGGVSDQSTLSNIYLYDGVQRLTDGYSFNTQGSVVINVPFTVNGSRTISVKADVAVADYDIYVTLAGFTSGNSVSMVNLKGNDMFIAGGTTLASASLKCNTVTGAGGSTTAGSCAAGAAVSVNAGTSSYRVWSAPIQINTRTLWLKAANLRITGSAPSDALSNVSFYVDGVKVGNNAAMTMANGSNYLSFDMTATPVSLTTGSHTLEVRGDVQKGSSYNLTVAIQQASDLMIYDGQVGVNLALSSSGYTSFQANTSAQINIGTGSFTSVVDPAFNSMTNVTGGASNIAIARFKIHGYGEDVKVTSLPVVVALSSAATPAGIQNVTLYFNGSQVGTQTTLTSASGVAGTLSSDNCTTTPGTSAFTCYTNTFSLGSQLIIPAGVDSTLEVRADLRNAAGTNYTAGTVSANLKASTAEGYTSHATIAGPATTGNALTVQTGLLAVAKNTGYANQTQNPNTEGVKISSFVLQNQSSSEGVRVTGFTVNPLGAGTSTLTNISGLRTSETSGNGSVAQQPAATNSFTTDFTLAPGATKIVDIFANTSSGTGTVIPTLAVSALGSSSNTDVSQTAQTGQTVTFSAGTVATPTLLTSLATKAQYIAAADPTGTGTGASDATKASYTFVSTGGASTVSELKFTISGTATTPVMSVKVGTVSASVVNGVAWLQNLSIPLANGLSTNVDALITYAPVGTSGVTPNTTAITTLTYVKYSSGGTTTVITPSVSAPTITLVGSKPVVTISSVEATGLKLTGVGKIGEVVVAADAKGNIKVNKIVFTLDSSGFTTAPTAVAGTVISDNNSSSSAITGAVCTPASLVVTCTLDTDANASLTNFDGYEISAGTSKTFSLFGSLTGAANTGTGTPKVTSSVGASTFNWDDSSTNGVTGTNLTGTLIYNGVEGFPSSSYSIRQ